MRNTETIRPRVERRPDPVFTEYSSANAVLRYTKKTAGCGIAYLLEHEYGDIYRAALHKYLSAPVGEGIRFLEFGCGGGMNLIHFLSILQREEIPLGAAYGTDLSERLIEAARAEMNGLASEYGGKVNFLVARNERLISDITGTLNIPRRAVIGSFHLIVGVNTFRYCHRLGKEKNGAKDIYDLLMPGGVCVMIDYNRKFSAVRHLLRDRLAKPGPERHLPTLDEYGSAFSSAGFEILEKRNTCWIPHSAGPALLKIGITLTPLLNWLIPQFAMRSLVISKKPI